MFCYLLLAIIAGYLANIYVFRGCIDSAVQSNVRNEYTKDPKVTLYVLSAMAGAIAPVTLVVLVIPVLRQRVYDALSDILHIAE